MNRRSFLQTSAATAALASLPFSIRAQDKAGAKKFRVVLIGCGWWGNNILREALASGACELVGLCDVDARQFEPTMKNGAASAGTTPKLFKDYRECLAQMKPDIAIIGTPDHWHALPMIAAVKAGAHVYVEKPIGHTVMEGRAMVNAARATGRVVQVGTHRRISPHNVSGRDFIRSGKIGDIGMVRCFVNYGGSGPEKPLPTVEVPKELDWDMWCGPAPLRPFNGGDPRNPSLGAGNRGIHPRGFRNYLDYANGTLGDWGIHWLDQVLWVTGEKYPKRVFSTGGRPIAGPAVSTPAVPNPFVFWFSMNFGAGTSLGGSCFRRADGAMLGSGWIQDGEGMDTLEAVRVETTFRPGSILHETVSMIARTGRGSELRIEGQVINMCPTKIPFPGGATFVNEGLARFTMGGLEGFGIAESWHNVTE